MCTNAAAQAQLVRRPHSYTVPSLFLNLSLIFLTINAFYAILF